MAYYSYRESKEFAKHAKTLKVNQNVDVDLRVRYAAGDIAHLMWRTYGFVPTAYISYFRNKTLRQLACIPDGYNRVVAEMQKYGWAIECDDENKCFVVDMKYMVDHIDDLNDEAFKEGNPNDYEYCDDDDDSTFGDDIAFDGDGD